MDVTKDAIDLGVLVRDVAGCLKFYTEDLGFPLVESVPFPNNRTQHRIRIGGSLLKLMEFNTEPPPPAGPTDRAAQAGIRYFTVTVRDLPAVVKDLEAKGLTFSVPLRESRPGVWIAMVQDPDGNTVELLEQTG